MAVLGIKGAIIRGVIAPGAAYGRLGAISGKLAGDIAEQYDCGNDDRSKSNHPDEHIVF